MAHTPGKRLLPLNRKRAALALRVLRASPWSFDDDAESAITDLLADIQHLCEQRGLDYHDLARRADNHYSYESAGLEEGE